MDLYFRKMDVWNIDPFRFKAMERNAVRHEWMKYRRNFDYIIAATGEKDRTKIKNMFLAKAGPDVQEVFISIPGADVEEDAEKTIDPYQVAVDKLNEYFCPKEHEAFERNRFWTLKPEQSETVEEFAFRCQSLAQKCNFGDTENEARTFSVIDKVILFAPCELKERLLAKKSLDWDQTIRIISSYESVKRQAKAITAPGKDDALGFEQKQSSSLVNRVREKGPGCTRCGKGDHTSGSSLCPANNRECYKCKKMGHFGAQCKTPNLKRRPETSNYTTKRPRVERVRAIGNEEEERERNFIYSISDGDELIWVKIGGIRIQMLIDSGCNKNIISENVWRYLITSKAERYDETRECREVFIPYGDKPKPLVVLGKFSANLLIEDKGKKIEKIADFFVIKGGRQCLLGKLTARELGVLFIGLPSTHGVRALQGLAIQPFPKIEGVKVKIPIDPDVQPICQHPRRPPVALLSKIEEKIEYLLERDIIEPVEGGCEWVSPLVPIIKDNGELRLCVDMRRANAAILRERHLMPTIEDFLPRFSSAKLFSRLDIKEAFHQVELHEKSRYITTFITHTGLYRYKRLMFGIVIAPEVFQRIMEQILATVSSNVVNYIDDILVFAKSEEEHDRILRQVLRILKEKGIMLNQEKCIFKVPVVEFLGHKISNQGIEPTKRKIEALQKFRAPSSTEEVRSFLGLITYLARFLPDLATTTAPLRELTHSNISFTWSKRQEEAFHKLKEMVSDVKLLCFFDNNMRTRVIADASPVALGAVLVQFNGPNDDEPRPIAYASKSLTPTEQRYCQTEREALALVWAVERFAPYLLGRIFELETDHKPLETIFKPVSRPCARIERWILRLQSFRFVVKYRKGKANIADPLSRLVENEENEPFEQENKFMVGAVMESAAIDVEEVEESVKKDETLDKLKSCLQSGLWTEPAVKPYVPFEDELGLVGEMVVRGNKLVIPTALRDRMLDLAHEGHPGESVMKRRLRNRVWWPGMDQEVAKRVATCEGCRLVEAPGRPEPMTRRVLPLKPWVDIALDFLGPMPCGAYLLVVIDYFSRYKEIEIMGRITAKETVERLDKIFTRLGYPRTITLDNAKQLVGTELEEFSRKHGIHLNHSTPYWPQENGLVERQNRSLLKRLKISSALGRDWKKDLNEYLMMYYTTPHSTTGKTPTELLYGRTIRSKIPGVEDIETSIDRGEIQDQDATKKWKGKELEDRKRRAKESTIEEGDTVLAQNLIPGNKLQTTFNPTEFVVTEKQGPRITITDPETGKIFTRNSAHLKKIRDPSTTHKDSREKEEETGHLNINVEGASDCREKRERKAPSKLKDYVVQ